MPSLVHFFIRLTPTYRRHANNLHKEFSQVIDIARERAAGTEGEKGLPYEAINTLDLMVGTGSTAKDQLPDNEIRDELMTCAWTLPPS